MGWFDDMGGKTTLPASDEALPGRDQAIEVPKRHHVLGTSLTEYPANSSRALFGMGCFWGVERLFWHQPGVFTTAVGYSGGYTPNPTYEEVCSGRTGHNEVVLVIFDPGQLTFQQLLKLFWENHNPTQGMRQANDRGTQYRSAIYWFDESQRQQAEQSRSAYQGRLDAAPGAPVITTEIKPAGPFYFAEPYHQQYLAKNPGGYCNLQTHDKTGFPALEI